MANPKQKINLSDPFLGSDVNLDLSSYPQISNAVAGDSSDPFLGDDVHLVAENKNRLRDAVLRLANSRDGEVAEYLKQANIEDPTAAKTFYLRNGDRATVHLGADNVWRVARHNEEGTQNTIRLPDAKTREEAQTQAAQHFAQNEVRIRQLNAEEELYVIRLCQLGKLEDAISNYLYFRCGETAGAVAEDPRYLEVSNTCVWFVFEHSTPAFSEDARAFMQQRLANRKVLNYQILAASFREYEMEHARAGLSLLPQRHTEPEPVEIDLESLSDDEIASLKNQTMYEFARQLRRQ
jgi:hypothetical protein